MASAFPEVKSETIASREPVACRSTWPRPVGRVHTAEARFRGDRKRIKSTKWTLSLVDKKTQWKEKHTVQTAHLTVYRRDNGSSAACVEDGGFKDRCDGGANLRP